MTKELIQKPKPLRIIEYILLTIVLGVLTLRTSLTESLTPQTTGITGDYTQISGIVFSGVLIFAALVWLLISVLQGKFMYRLTGIEIPLLIFIISAVISGFAASNKRVAITDSAHLIAPIAAALLIVQLLDTKNKLKIVLIVIVSMAAVNAWQCCEQFLTGNEIMIEQYEQDPQAFLEPLGIRKNTLQHLLFEHRLYSKGVRGFFSTANSAGSFLMFGFFSLFALTGREFLKFTRKKITDNYLKAVLVLFFITAALLLTQSKGAVIAFLIAAVGFFIYYKFPDKLYRHRRLLFTTFILAVILAISAVIGYGLKFDTLPGGNSMLVRWQYWKASFQMYLDHPIFGVGGGNFADYYTHYKPPAAIESVSNPHNFILNILTQYGILGFLGFSAAVIYPIYKAFQIHNNQKTENLQNDRNFERLSLIYMLILAAGLLVLRKVIDQTPIGYSPSVILYVFFVMYVVPVIVFMVAFRLCTVGGKNPDSGFIKAAMLSAAAGVVLHNMIDFAIFEGGILVTFWITIAVLPAVQYINNPQYMKIYRITLPAKIILCLIVFMVIFSYISNVFLPVKKSGNLTNQAFQSENPLKIFEKAKQADKLSPVSSELAGEFCLQRYYRSKQNQWLDIAGNNFMTAVKRNPADYKNYEKLSRVYELLGNYDKAADFTRLAIQRYPGIARLRYNLAVLSERLGNTDTALKQYQKAVEIEDAYRLQFRAMYPEMDIFSRLGEEKYKTAKKRIKNLKNP
jgi:hypothetical protein